MNPDHKEQQRREIERIINEQCEREAAHEREQQRQRSASGKFDPPRAKDDAKPPPDNED